MKFFFHQNFIWKLLFQHFLETHQANTIKKKEMPKPKLGDEALKQW